MTRYGTIYQDYDCRPIEPATPGWHVWEAWADPTSDETGTHVYPLAGWLIQIGTRHVTSSGRADDDRPVSERPRRVQPAIWLVDHIESLEELNDTPNRCYWLTGPGEHAPSIAHMATAARHKAEREANR